MALNKTIPVITLACLFLAQPLSAYTFAENAQIRFDEAKALVEEGYNKARSATEKAVNTAKRNKEVVLAVASVSALAAFCIYETFYAEKRSVLPSTSSINTVYHNALVKLGLRSDALAQETALTPTATVVETVVPETTVTETIA